jgi:hypothetical protein
MFIRILNIAFTCYCPIQDLVKSDIHGKDIRQSSDLQQIASKLSYYQRGIHYTGIKIFK